MTIRKRTRYDDISDLTDEEIESLEWREADDQLDDIKDRAAEADCYEKTHQAVSL